MRPTTCLAIAIAALAAASAPADDDDGKGPKLPDAVVELQREARDAAKAGEMARARRALKRAVEGVRDAGPSQRKAELLDELGEASVKLGLEAEGIAAYEEALEVQTAVFGADDARTGLALDKLADAHVHVGEHAKAVPLYTELLRAMADGLGDSHPGYRATLSKLGAAALSAKKPKAAASAYRRLIALAEGGQAPGGPAEAASQAASAHLQLSRALAASGKLKAALRHAQAARDSYGGPEGAGAGAGSLDHAFTLNGVAGALERLGRDDEAVASMSEALRLASAAPGTEADVVAAAEKNLAGLRSHIERKRQRREAKREL